MATSKQIQASFNAMAGPFFAKGPRDATDLFAFDGWLKQWADLPADERCMLVNWVATGRNDAWWYEPDGAVEICAKQGHDVSLSQSLTDLRKAAGDYPADTVEQWGKRQQTKWQAVQKANAKQDTAKIVKKAKDVTVEVASAVKEGAESTARAAPWIIGAAVVVAVVLVAKKLNPAG